MKIGVLKETKPEEYRVPLVPAGAAALIERGHSVWVQAAAGVGAGFADEAYRQAGAELVATAADVYAAADLLLKVKEPTPPEFAGFRTGQALFCYLHSETRPQLVDLLLERQLTAIAFENVRASDGSLPLLAPMSIIAGQQAIVQGMQFLCNHRGGVGTSLVAYPGLEPPRVVVLGAGVAGWHAALTAAGLGAEVALFEIDLERIRQIAPGLPANVRVLHSLSVDLEPYLVRANLIVNAATVPPASDRHLIDRSLLKRLQPGTVIVDVTANLGGAVETIDRYTTHDDPVWQVDGVIHYAVTNIPGTVARTASRALAMAVLPYLLELADLGVPRALLENPALCSGLTAIAGRLTWQEAGRMQDRPWIEPERAVREMSERAAGRPALQSMLGD